MDIYPLKFIALLFILEVNVFFADNGTFCHEGIYTLPKFNFYVPYNVSNSVNLNSNRNFKGFKTSNEDASYLKGISTRLKNLCFISSVNSRGIPFHFRLNYYPNKDSGYKGYYHRFCNKYCENNNNINSDYNLCRYHRNVPLFMTRKVTYGYRYNAEKVKRKGTVRSKIYFDMWKDKNPYYIIHKFLYENDPDNKNFNYDIDLARKVKCKRNIFAHYKKDNRLRFFWYASRKNTAKGPCSRYINFAIDRNEFRFSKLYSFFHILPYVHEHYKDDPRYIYFMNRFLSRHGRVAAFKRMHSNTDGTGEGSLDNTNLDSNSERNGIGDGTTDGSISSSSDNTLDNNTNSIDGDDTGDTSGSPKPIKYRRTISWKDMLLKAKTEEEELFKTISTEPIEVDLGDGRSFTVKRDGFKVYGEYYSKINKKNRKSPYDIYSPFLKTKHSSKRRRYREKIPLDPSLRCKTRRERILKNAEKRDIRKFIQKYVKQKPKYS